MSWHIRATIKIQEKLLYGRTIISVINNIKKIVKAIEVQGFGSLTDEAQL